MTQTKVEARRSLIQQGPCERLPGPVAAIRVRPLRGPQIQRAEFVLKLDGFGSAVSWHERVLEVDYRPSTRAAEAAVNKGIKAPREPWNNRTQSASGRCTN
jgi:hypothetical protein